MNHLFLKALEGESVERPPVWIMRQAGRYLPDFMKLKAKYGFNKSVSARIKWPDLAAAVDEAGIFDIAPAPTFVSGRFEAEDPHTHTVLIEALRQKETQNESAHAYVQELDAEVTLLEKEMKELGEEELGLLDFEQREQLKELRTIRDKMPTDFAAPSAHAAHPIYFYNKLKKRHRTESQGADFFADGLIFVWYISSDSGRLVGKI